MNKKEIWTIVGIVVVIIIGAWYVFSDSSKGNMDMTSMATTTSPMSSSTPQTTKSVTTTHTSTSIPPKPAAPQKVLAPTKIAGVNTVAYLESLKETLVCDVKTTNASIARSGTMYIANGEMRVNFANTSMIDDGSYLYAWTDGASTGLKLLAAPSASGSAIANAGGIDPALSFSFACSPWTFDASVFTAPSAISFSANNP